MDLVMLRQLLAIVFSVLGSIFAILSFFNSTKSKKDSQRKAAFRSLRIIILILCTVVIVGFISLSAYLELTNSDLTTANLVITVAKPRAVNVGGSEVDKFVVDADSIVTTYSTEFVINATVRLTNTKTLQKYEYHPVYEENGFMISNVNSGKYRIEIFSGDSSIYYETILLNKGNVLYINGKDTWLFTAFLFDEFWDNAIEFSVSLNENTHKIEYPVFTLSSESYNMCEIFCSNVDQSSGVFAGKFYGYPGRYILDNAISDSQMPSIPIIVE